MSKTPAVRVERDGPVTTVILSRPDVRNAVDGPTAAALADAFLAFERDPDAQVAVFFGDHGTFCAGADLKAISAGRGNRVDEPATGSDWNPLGDRRPDGPDAHAALEAGDRGGRRAMRWRAGSSSRSGATCAWSRRTRCSACSAAAGACR